MSDYPRMIAGVDLLEPVPRRVRATLGGKVVLDTIRALYVTTSGSGRTYPQYYVPVANLAAGVLVDEGRTEQLSRGGARLHGLRVGDIHRAACVRVYAYGCLDGLAGTARLAWAALDAWFEAEEEVFVHPRNPYARVDALRSTRSVRIELEVMLAESTSVSTANPSHVPRRIFSRSPAAVYHEPL